MRAARSTKQRADERRAGSRQQAAAGSGQQSEEGRRREKTKEEERRREKREERESRGQSKSTARLREAEQLMTEGRHRAAAAVLTKLLRQAPGDVKLHQLAAEASRLSEEADAAAEVQAQAAEADLLAMLDNEAGGVAALEPGAPKSKAQQKRERQKAQKRAALHGPAAPEPEPVPVAIEQSMSEEPPELVLPEAEEAEEAEAVPDALLGPMAV
jgi:dTMP kinase